MRLLGVDFGFKRIGIAVGDSGPAIFSPRTTLAASGALVRDAQAISDVARREEAGEIVVGWPLGAEGEEGRMARICATLAGHLRALGWTVHLIDESLTSIQANESPAMAGLKASRRRRIVDGEAAALILERFVDEAKAS